MLTSSRLRLVVILATIAIAGITTIQIYWVKRAFSVESDQFNRDVNQALFSVVNSIFTISEGPIPNTNPIQQLSSNYFVVTINQDIDANLLEYLLQTEFAKRNIEADFEYGIYDCTSQNMVYGNYVTVNKGGPKAMPTTLPKWDKEAYYFGVYFPTKERIVLNRLGIWVFSSIVLLLVIVFFAYTLVVIFRQKRLSEVQKDFINNMTHEFKTPISTISISAEVLKDGAIAKAPDRLNNYAGIIYSEAKRLQKMVEKVLQVSSWSDKGIELNNETCNLEEVVQESIQSVRVMLKDSDCKVSYALQLHSNMVQIDRFHLTNVLFNLFDNAVKYADAQPEGHLQVSNYQNGLLFALRDNGIGVPEESKKLIFTKFYRVPKGDQHDVKGFGLGLNYVKLVVDTYGGWVSVKDNEQPAKGSTFQFFIPQ